MDRQGVFSKVTYIEGNIFEISSVNEPEKRYGIKVSEPEKLKELCEKALLPNHLIVWLDDENNLHFEAYG